jgi:hypothetical protein
MGHWITNTQFTWTVDLDTQHTISHSHYKAFLIVVMLNCNKVQQIWIEIFLLSDLTSSKFIANEFPLTLRVLVVNAAPQFTTEFFQSAPKSVPIECHHISRCFAILYSMNSSNIPTWHMLHGSGWCILFQFFETKKLMFLTARQKYSLYDPIFSWQKFPWKVSIKFANKKKQSLSLLLIVCGGLEGHSWLLDENGNEGIGVLLVKLSGGEDIWRDL